MNKKQRQQLHDMVINYLEDKYDAIKQGEAMYQYLINTKYGVLEVGLDGMHYESEVFSMFCRFKEDKDIYNNPLISLHCNKYNLHCMYTDPLEKSFQRVVDHLKVTQ